MPQVTQSPHLSRRVPLDSLCPEATFAKRNATISSGKPARDALEKN
jgi:hypothetical protein